MAEEVTKERINHLYWEQGLSQREVGAVLGCSQMQVRRLMWKFEIKSRDYTQNKMPVKKGSHLTKAHREAISKASFGKKGLRGPDHPNWKGGISGENRRIRESTRAKAWRKAVFERDDYTCQMVNCMKRGVALEAHHIKSFSQHPKLRFVVANGITLCKSCHKDITGRQEGYLEEYFKYRARVMGKIYKKLKGVL